MALPCCSRARGRAGDAPGAAPGDAPGASPAPSSIPGSTRGHCGIWATPASAAAGVPSPQPGTGWIGRLWKLQEQAPSLPLPGSAPAAAGSPRTGWGRILHFPHPRGGVSLALQKPKTPPHSPAFPLPSLPAPS